ncbi:MAG: pilus assembly protein TadG-related protein [Bacillota bacterium]
MSSHRRGAVAAMVILLLPAFTALLALVADLGLVLHARAALRASADLAALAGVQELDLEALAQGEPRLLPDVAMTVANTYARANISKQLGNAAGQVLQVKVDVYNASAREPLVHDRTGRLLEAPTVCVRLTLPLRLVLATRIMGRSEYRVEAHADAAVVRR